MDTVERLKWRYATKKFDIDKKLSKDQLNTLKQAFNLTATSFGLQTIKLLVVSDKVLRNSLVNLAYGQRQVVDASHLLIICIQDNILDEDVNSFYKNIKATRDTSEAILEPYRKDLINFISKKSIEERLQWSKNQAYIALGNLMTVCAVEGIDACPMEGFISSKYDELLDLGKKGLKSVLLLPVGFRAKDDLFSEYKKVRKSIEETVIEI